MSVLIVQQGHCYRTTGATGTDGEQSYATEVARRCVRLLDGRGGWRVRPTLADVNDYRGDAFVAVHCDGAVSSTARGASTGYQTSEGQAFAQAWKRAYAARGWPVFRPDNYTSALANHYGVRNAVAVGTRRAIIIECGFLTSPVDRALLTGPGGPERVALAIGDALGITTEADMTLTPDQNNAVRDTWKIIDNLGESGPEWERSNLRKQLGSVVDEINEATQRATDAVSAAQTAVQAVIALGEKVDQLVTGGVDLEALALRVVQLLEQRARDNDPSTGPTT